MKFAFVMPYQINERGGGAEVQAWFLAKELSSRNYEVHYICQTLVPGKINTSEKLEGVNVHKLKRSGKFPVLDQNKYFTKLTEVKPDIVIQRMTSNVSGVIGKYCKKYGKKFVWIATDDYVPYKSFHKNNFIRYQNLKNTNPVKYIVFYINALINDYFREKGMKNISKAFTQNDSQKSILKENFGLDSFRMFSGHPEPVEILPAVEKFKKKKVLWAANLGRRKRPELFVELSKKLNDKNINCVLVGGAADKDYVNSLFKEKPDNLTTTGKLSFDDALKHFDDAAVFVNSSTKEGDGFPNTFIQAWLRGVPVVSFAVNPNKIITENNLGYLSGSIEDAAEKIESLLQNEQEYISLSNSCLEYARENHTISKMASNFLNVVLDK